MSFLLSNRQKKDSYVIMSSCLIRYFQNLQGQCEDESGRDREDKELHAIVAGRSYERNGSGADGSSRRCSGGVTRRGGDRCRCGSWSFAIPMIPMRLTPDRLDRTGSEFSRFGIFCGFAFVFAFVFAFAFVSVFFSGCMSLGACRCYRCWCRDDSLRCRSRSFTVPKQKMVKKSPHLVLAVEGCTSDRRGEHIPLILWAMGLDQLRVRWM